MISAAGLRISGAEASPSARGFLYPDEPWIRLMLLRVLLLASFACIPSARAGSLDGMFDPSFDRLFQTTLLRGRSGTPAPAVGPRETDSQVLRRAQWHAEKRRMNLPPLAPDRGGK